MAEMMRRRAAFGTQGLMAALDCATLYALTRAQRPAVVIESGGFVGLSSAFILKALADEGEVPAATVAEAIKKYGLDSEKPNPVTV